ncbi:MAG: zinc resistance protein [Desulfovibrionaceae bacterium]|nr:zinc resistance protein [Desulfovibrionaceae bacterium]
MKRLLSLSLAVMLVMAFAGSALGYGGGRWQGAGLTPEQTTKMQQIFKENRALMDPIMQEIRVKKAEWDAQVHSASPDQGKIEALSKELGVLKGKIYSARAGLNLRLAQEGLPTGYGDHRNGRGGCGGGKKGFGRMSRGMR